MENTPQSPMIAIRLIDGTRVVASRFRVTPNNIWVDDLKYCGDDEVPVSLQDSMLFAMGAVETYLIIHKGEKNVEEVSENRDGASSPT